MAGTNGKMLIVGLLAGVVLGAGGVMIFIRHVSSQSTRESRAEPDARVLTMTPNQFVSRCGKLISDKLEASAGVLPGEKPEYDRDVTVELTIPVLSAT